MALSKNHEDMLRDIPALKALLGITNPLLLVVRRQIFTATGTYTPHANMLYCEVEIVGSGAGGGGVTGANPNTAGSAGGGGSGGFSKSILSKAAIGASKPVTIGAAGVGGAAGNNPGTAGNTCSLGTLVTALGGLGGLGNFDGLGGSGAAAGVGDIALPGTSGAKGLVLSAIANGFIMPGMGAPSVYGGSPIIAQLRASLAGRSGTKYGAGGDGGVSWDSTGLAQPGGNGATGLVVITEICSE